MCIRDSHVAEELWEQLGHEGSVFKAGWPTYDENEMKDDEIQVPVQINGKDVYKRQEQFFSLDYF